jgi:hypothetical protein
MLQTFAPAPSTVGKQTIVCPDVVRIDAKLDFDVPARHAIGTARIELVAGVADGHPTLDLRQEVTGVRLDGRSLAPDAFAPLDLGGGLGAEMRVLDVSLDAETAHQLEIDYDLGTPSCTDAVPIGWTDGGLRFDTWMSDLHPGRYLEMWVPAPLVHDRFSLTIEMQLRGADRPHLAFANTGSADVQSSANAWKVEYPDHYTALSPMLVVAPADTLEVRRTSIDLPGRERSLALLLAADTDIKADLGACEADITSWLTYLATRYEPWVHGDTFTAVIWAASRGMEYDGATTAAVEALEHEVFHSWFGRGVKPARASDGWIDEAWTTWSTASRRSETPRFGVIPLGLDEDPVELYPQHPWARRTVVESYSSGARLFGGLADLLGGADRLRAAMADWYRANAGGLITTDGLGAHIQAWSGVDIGPWWARYVHGRG